MEFRFLFSARDFAEMEGTLRQVDDIIASEITGGGAKEMAEIAAEEARSIVQVDTGKTRDSIRVRPARDNAKRRYREQKYFIFAGREDHRAALFLELGTVKMRPYPFLRPAVQRTYDTQYRGFVNAVKRGFRRLAGAVKSRLSLRGRRRP